MAGIFKRPVSWKVSTSQKLLFIRASPCRRKANPAGFEKRAEASSAAPTEADPMAPERADELRLSMELEGPEREKPDRGAMPAEKRQPRKKNILNLSLRPSCLWLISRKILLPDDDFFPLDDRTRFYQNLVGPGGDGSSVREPPVPVEDPLSLLERAVKQEKFFRSIHIQNLHGDLPGLVPADDDRQVRMGPMGFKRHVQGDEGRIQRLGARRKGSQGLFGA